MTDPACEAIKSLEDFRASRQPTIDLGAAISEEWADGKNGFVYAGLLHIEGSDGGPYCLTIGNRTRSSDNLAELEGELYEFGLSEDYFPNAPRENR